MTRFRTGLAMAWPAVCALGLSALILILGASPGESQTASAPPAASTVDIIVTSDLWKTFYPTGPSSADQKERLSQAIVQFAKEPGEKLLLDTGSFSGLTMLTETDYRPGALGLFLANKFDAINLGRQESTILPIELELLLRRAGDAGVRSFVSSFNAAETTFTPQWTPHIEVKKGGTAFLIGGIARDIQKDLFKEDVAMFSGIDNQAYARSLIAAAKEKSAIPILLADADTNTATALAKTVEGLPLIFVSEPENSASGKQELRVGGTLIIAPENAYSITRARLELSPQPAPSARVVQRKTAPYGPDPSIPATTVSYWPAALPRAAEWPPMALPEIGLALDNDYWLRKMGLKPNAVELNVISGAIMKKFPAANTTGHYYHIGADDAAGERRLIYIRHQLPHPYPGIYFLVMTDLKGVITKIYFPFDVLLGTRQSVLADWAKGLEGSDDAALDASMAAGDLGYYHAMLAADIYHALKILDAGAL